MTLPLHGANPHFLYRELGIKQPELILDFSVNTNPFPRLHHFNEFKQLLEATIEQYPDPNASKLMECIVNNNEDIEFNEILVGNGGSECIFLLANYFRGKNICIVEPTFGEYRKACRAYGCNIESFVLTEQNNWSMDLDKFNEYIKRNDVVFICQPNNPTGTTYSLTTVLEIIKEANKHNTFCVIDQAFYDFCMESLELSSYIKDYSNLIILRSLTKMYRLAGVRLGYILANSSLIAKLKNFQPPWSVNGVAQVLGELAIKDSSLVLETKFNIQKERELLLASLDELGYYVSDSKVNFFILREKGDLKDTKELIMFMLKNGIVPRHTYNFIGLDGSYIRLAIKTSTENCKLIEVLKRWKDRC